MKTCFNTFPVHIKKLMARWTNPVLLKHVWIVSSLVSKRHNRLFLRNCKFHVFFFYFLYRGLFNEQDFALSLLNIQIQYQLCVCLFLHLLVLASCSCDACCFTRSVRKLCIFIKYKTIWENASRPWQHENLGL